MDIKDFIKDSLLQIVDGISESNEALKAKGASIPTKNIAGEGGYQYAKPVSKDGDIILYLKVDYDIAVEVSEGSTANVNGEIGTKGASIKVAKIVDVDMNTEAKAGGFYERQKESQSIHRIMCTRGQELCVVAIKRNEQINKKPVFST